MKTIRLIFLSIIFILIQSGSQVADSILVPATGLSKISHFGYAANQKSAYLTDFVKSVQNNNPYQIAGIFASDTFAFPIVQQPSGQPGYVATTRSEVTQFSTASQFGTIGLIAHNYLAGADFFSLSNNQEIVVVYGDGLMDLYRVVEIKQYQALSPSSPYSSFINLEDPDKVLTYKELFYETYGLGGVLILQTCIEKGSSDSWGRLFVMAEKVISGFSDFSLYTTEYTQVSLQGSNDVYSRYPASMLPMSV